MFIGITQRLILNESYYEERECLAKEWGELFNSELFQGFLPLPLSFEIDFSLYKKHLKAVILSGGNDLNFLNPNAMSKKRDNYETQIIQTCIKEKIPLLGICRGAQMIAHFFKSTIELCENHTKDHEIFFESKSFNVNSFHNFAITKLGDELMPLCFAQDKTIEAFKHKNEKIYALMWHIERKNGLSNTQILKEWLKLVKEKI